MRAWIVPTASVGVLISADFARADLSPVPVIDASPSGLFEIIAGVALSLAFVFGGLWIARRFRKQGRIPIETDSASATAVEEN